MAFSSSAAIYRPVTGKGNERWWRRTARHPGICSGRQVLAGLAAGYSHDEYWRCCNPGWRRSLAITGVLQKMMARQRHLQSLPGPGHGRRQAIRHRYRGVCGCRRVFHCRPRTSALEECYQQASWSLAGLAVTADRLGSNILWFPYREPVYRLAEIGAISPCPSQERRGGKRLGFGHSGGGKTEKPPSPSRPG